MNLREKHDLTYQRHQRSPDLSPGNEYIGMGVDRSFPRDLLTTRNLSSTCQREIHISATNRLER